MKKHNNEYKGIFIQPIDQNYAQEDISDQEFLIEISHNELPKFYRDLMKCEEDVELKTCCTKNIKRNKNKLKKLLKPKWEEKISLMKTNYFLYAKSYTTRSVESFKRIFLNKICDVLRIIITIYIFNINTTKN